MKDWSKPVSPQIYSISNGVSQELKTRDPGMTLLDYFASQALAGSDPFEYQTRQQHASYCYATAKAMIEERAKVIAELEKENK